ncbi:MAG: intermembrane transport protein PqiB [Chthoniobacteraceae bacterium]
MIEHPKITPPPVPAAPVVRRRRRLSPVWIIPIVAALLGLWLVWQHYAAQGVLVEVRFETAEGVAAGKTPVQCRSVNVGIVETVRLAEGLKSVVAAVRINRDAAALLRSDSRFWVVRPRFGGTGISGLGTLVSGTYIELDPGVSEKSSRTFHGLENPPVTPLGVPGLHVTLVADKTGSIGVGSSISYRGIKAGRIESLVFNPKINRVEFGAFIEGDYGKRITGHSRFWNVSGVDLDISADGVHLRTGTLESLIAGGVAFDTGEDDGHAIPARDGTIFPLYDTYEDTEKTSLNPRLTYLLLFKESVRGLSPNAPVEFRGIRVGTVAGISFDYLPDDPERRVPVLIKIDPSFIPNVPKDDISAGPAAIAESVRQGLCATLRTGNLLTGQMFVSLDMRKDASPAEVVEIGGYRTLPTISSGLGQLQDKVTAVLDKIQGLKLDELVDNGSGALAEIKKAAVDLKGAAAGLSRLMDSPATQALPAELKTSLAALRKTLDGFNENSAIYREMSVTIRDLSSALRSIESLATTIERKPSSLLWGNPKGTVKPPKGKP